MVSGYINGAGGGLRPRKLEVGFLTHRDDVEPRVDSSSCLFGVSGLLVIVDTHMSGGL